MKPARDEKQPPLYQLLEELGTGGIPDLMKEMASAHPSFQNFIQGKSISLVGPAKSLIAEGKGEVIDRADLVVRINNSLEFVNQSSPKIHAPEEDIGKRLDILYLSSGHISSYLKRPKILRRAFQKNQIAVVVCGNSEPEISEKNLQLISKLKEFLAEDFIHPEFHITPPPVIHQLEEWLQGFFGSKRVPTTGLVCLLELLVAGAREIHLHGFTFYKTHRNMFRVAFDKEEKFKDHFKKHDPDAELETFQCIRRLFPGKLHPDETLEKLLEGGWFPTGRKLNSWPNTGLP